MFLVFLLTSSGANPNGKNKKPKQGSCKQHVVICHMLIVICMYETFATKLCSSDIASAFPAVPAIECEMRAGKINLSEFIVKCPANCRETKEKVYGAVVFASISSICNAAIHR